MTTLTPPGSIAVPVVSVALSLATWQPGQQPATAVSGTSHPVATATLSHVGTVDDRYQSFNVEMLEVTGGKFWKPYGPELEAILKEGKSAAAAPSGSDTPAGMDPRLYEELPPIDLGNARLRKLASALSPAYVRVSGTWANTTYFPDSDAAPPTPPAGFAAVLTHAQWKSVVDFSRAVDAKIVTSFATGVGTRDDTGAWTDRQARRLLDFTKAIGGSIYAAEFMNEPTLAAMGGAPKGYDAVAYGRDFKRFRTFAKQAAPEMLILGPGSVGETTGNWGVAYGDAPIVKTRDLLAASGPGVDAFSYHHYGASSQRCAAMGKQTTADAALSEDWLQRTDETLAFYRKLRDEFEPGKTFWVTETADAACGGEHLS
jgi:heparanase 1